MSKEMTAEEFLQNRCHETKSGLLAIDFVNLREYEKMLVSEKTQSLESQLKELREENERLKKKNNWLQDQFDYLRKERVPNNDAEISSLKEQVKGSEEKRNILLTQWLFTSGYIKSDKTPVQILTEYEAE